MSTQPNNQYTVISVSRIWWPYKRVALISRSMERAQRRDIEVVVSGDPRLTCIAIDYQLTCHGIIVLIVIVVQ